VRETDLNLECASMMYLFSGVRCALSAPNCTGNSGHNYTSDTTLHVRTKKYACHQRDRPLS